MLNATKPSIIFDTDMDTDCDDAGALAMLLNGVREGRVDLMGIITDAPVPEAAPCCEAFCRYYGVDVPIGAVRADDYAYDSRFAAYRDHRNTMPSGRLYNRVFANALSKCDADYDSAVSVYRRLLSGVQDDSVVIVCVGFLTALAELLNSPPDLYSPLTGRELMRQKVRCVISMGELPQLDERCTSFNYAMDLTGTERFFECCPVPVLISPEGTDVITGGHLTDVVQPEHPLRIAYENWNGPRQGRSSWDLIAVLYAMKPEHPWLCVHPLGMVRADAEHQRMWCAPKSFRTDKLISVTADSAELAAYLNTLLV